MKNSIVRKRLGRLKILLIACILIMPCTTYSEEVGKYELSLSFLPEKSQLTGTAKLTIPPGQGLKLFLDELAISGSLLRTGTGKEYQLSLKENVLTLKPHPEVRELFLSYTYDSSQSNSNIISKDGISLTSNWFPAPQEPMLFTITATLPDQFSAIVEADHFPLAQDGNEVKAVYSRPTTAIHFNAGLYILQKLQVRDKFYVYTMFFKEDEELASGYLLAARKYLLRYEDEIGPFPYNHYVIVANRLPTGYGMPTFTLLGQMVLRLPFIRTSSLGHEIVHSWFGNSVEVAHSSGNWCEGLTAFLTDQRFKEEKGEGINYRKESITKYLNYVSATSPIGLREFYSASHSQPMAQAKRAVGYNRGAMFFHELREKLGPDLFHLGLRRFYHDKKEMQASWEDLRRSFESAAETDLSRFFQERLSRKDIPSLSLENVQVSYNNNRPVLSFHLIQETELPYTLTVPIHVTTSGGITKVSREISDLNTEITIELQHRPISFAIDPEYSFLRQLSADEIVPVWSHFLGSDKKMVILADEKSRARYKDLLKSLQRYEPKIVTAEEVTNAELSQYSLLFLDAAHSQSPSRTLFGQVDHPLDNFTLDTRQNPLNPDHVAVLVSSKDQAQVSSVVRKLSHYGKYSYLEFHNGLNRIKTINNSVNGIRYILEKRPEGNSTKSINSFTQIIEELARHRVIYVGESHTSASDHLLQLQVIETLHEIVPNLAIGMEMFPKSSQPALDTYTLQENQMDEQDFLRKSKYYDVWRYDYRFFRDIFHFAKSNRLPVIGLNIDRTIVSQVFRDGNTDGLSSAALNEIAAERDLDMAGYGKRLEQIYSIHTKDGHATGLQSGFIQAQAIWDETMAENIANFLQSHPDYTMVVLAGSQHTRKDSGIPPRVARRIEVKQASVLNIASQNSPENLSEIADYYFFNPPLELPELPKIGIVLSTIVGDQPDTPSLLRIDQLSPHGKAKEAGLRAGDILLSVKGVPVSSMSDLKIAMLDSEVGGEIAIEVMRSEGSKEQSLTFTVELTSPGRPQGHP